MISKLLSLAAVFFLVLGLMLPMNAFSNSSGTGTTDTIQLVTNIDTAKLIPGKSDTVNVWLTCGCPFALNVAGQGGYFVMSRLADDTSRITPHKLIFSLSNTFPANQHQMIGSIGLSAVDHFGNTKTTTLYLSGSSN